MVKLIHSETSPNQEPGKDKCPRDKGSSEVTKVKLKLVASNSNPIATSATPSQDTPNVRSSHTPFCFTVEVHVKGPSLYEMTLQDPFNHLACALTLEVEESNQEHEGNTVICYFPTLSDEGLNDFIGEDEILCGMLMIQFQMKILKQLFLFCATHYASMMVIFADDDQADDLGVYQDFLTYEDQTLTHKGEKTEMVIPADRETFDAWIAFMDHVNIKFQQSLWRDHRSNPIIRQHLKTHPLG